MDSREYHEKYLEFFVVSEGAPITVVNGSYTDDEEREVRAFIDMDTFPDFCGLLLMMHGADAPDRMCVHTPYTCDDFDHAETYLAATTVAIERHSNLDAQITVHVSVWNEVLHAFEDAPTARAESVNESLQPVRWVLTGYMNDLANLRLADTAQLN